MREDNDGRLTPQRERQLIKRARKGCAQSANDLIEAHADRLNAFVWRIVRNSHDAEEICQDTFLRAFKALDGFDFSYRFSTWLFTIGYRLCLNAIRKRKAYCGDVDFSNMRQDDACGLCPDIADQVANSDEARHLKKVIWNSVDRLTPPQKAAVLLFYRESRSCQEIGDILGMPAATVKSHLHRARNRLKELLESQYVDDWSQVRFGEASGAA